MITPGGRTESGQKSTVATKKYTGRKMLHMRHQIEDDVAHTVDKEAVCPLTIW